MSGTTTKNIGWFKDALFIREPVLKNIDGRFDFSDERGRFKDTKTDVVLIRLSGQKCAVHSKNGVLEAMQE